MIWRKLDLSDLFPGAGEKTFLLFENMFRDDFESTEGWHGQINQTNPEIRKIK